MFRDKRIHLVPGISKLAIPGQESIELSDLVKLYLKRFVPQYLDLSFGPVILKILRFHLVKENCGVGKPLEAECVCVFITKLFSMTFP